MPVTTSSVTCITCLEHELTNTITPEPGMFAFSSCSARPATGIRHLQFLDTDTGLKGWGLAARRLPPGLAADRRHTSRLIQRSCSHLNSCLQRRQLPRYSKWYDGQATCGNAVDCVAPAPCKLNCQNTIMTFARILRSRVQASPRGKRSKVLISHPLVGSSEDPASHAAPALQPTDLDETSREPQQQPPVSQASQLHAQVSENQQPASCPSAPPAPSAKEIAAAAAARARLAGEVGAAYQFTRPDLGPDPKKMRPS